ncbi:DUF434 domain-containing protein [Aquimarina sediminis]|uniref:DUF434 domain-containing protein n=1 Tax=Aquimarina sediminis TaxID=2070536 RepID=UPI000CA04E29|nr:DUF434 domain-containing protein [Aquimarina sediminis]
MLSRNRGKVASDDRLFGDPIMQQKLKDAVQDMSYLLSRGFAEKSSLQLVGNRYLLNVRQQKALLGMSASQEHVTIRNKRTVKPENIDNKVVVIDGFNLLITIESALSGAYLFKGIDGFYRDVSGVHGTYKRVQKTEEAILLVGNILKKLGADTVLWYFDAPVSNSGRLKTRLYELAAQYQFPWEIYLVNNPDKELSKSNHIVVSSDAWILNKAKQNFNLGAYLIENIISNINIVYAE